jgi:hypothetical protein
MGLDNYTRVIYGWKVTGKKIHKIQEELETVCEEIYHNDLYNIVDGYIIEDTMCGEYFYFGALLGSMDVYDCERGADNEIIITTELVDKVTSAYNQMLKDYPEIEKIFKKYSKNKKPQLYVMQNIW